MKLLIFFRILSVLPDEKYLSKNFVVISSQVLIDPVGEVLNYILAASFSENGNSLKYIAPSDALK